jgi:hypothetical protein
VGDDMIIHTPNKSLEPSAVGFYTVLQKKVGHCRLC